MSLFSSVAKLAKSAIGTISKTPLLGAVVKSIPGLGTAATIASVAGALGGGAVKTVKTVGKVIPGGSTLGKVATVGAVTTAYNVGSSTTPVYDQAGNLVGYQRRRRRMNYANPKAAKRAGRRIKGFLKLMHQVEKSLPHRTVHRRS